MILFKSYILLQRQSGKSIPMQVVTVTTDVRVLT